RVEDVDEAGQSQPQARAGLLNSGQCSRVAPPGPGDDGVEPGIQRYPYVQDLVSPLVGRGGHERLDATACLPAPDVAGGAPRTLRRDPHVPDFAGVAGGPAQEAAFGDDAAPYAGGAGDVYQIAHASGAATSELGQGSQVRVVVDLDVPGQSLQGAQQDL